ncbi:Hormone-sensitive lipase [Venturia nashicola]|uniref:Hormone-sensitive lipase n=1 Tax=Venturia nashicola TaxID=86259 RepID=A0A4Z1PD59_9PEZI|nr:Hormone-sensitive lipase [Venturia nashicola]TLD35773.1 Hormone-sensitive lipase [Venturia nashicola]
MSSISSISNPESRKDVEALSEIDPELDEFLAKNPFPPRDYSNLPAMRAARRIQEAAALGSLGPAPASVLETQQNISLPGGGTSEILVFQPKSASSPAPLIVLFHGGGFCVGSPSQLTTYGRSLCSTYGAVVASIGYRLAPGFKSPTQADDGWEGTKYVVDHAEHFGADPSKGFIVGGISAGGNLTAVTVARSLKTPLKYKITGVWLAVPCLLDASIVPEEYKHLFFSREQNKNAPLMGVDGVDAFNGAWSPDWKDEKVTPFAAKDLSIKFPPTYFQVCGLDPLRDDGLIYEKVLRKAGTSTRIHVYKGLPHASWAFLPMLSSSEVMVKDTMKGFGWLLGVEEREGDARVKSGGA